MTPVRFLLAAAAALLVISCSTSASVSAPKPSPTADQKAIAAKQYLAAAAKINAASNEFEPKAEADYQSQNLAAFKHDWTLIAQSITDFITDMRAINWPDSVHPDANAVLKTTVDEETLAIQISQAASWTQANAGQAAFQTASAPQQGEVEVLRADLGLPRPPLIGSPSPSPA